MIAPFSYEQLKLVYQELQEEILGMTAITLLAKSSSRFFIQGYQKEKQKNLFFCFDKGCLQTHLAKFPYKKKECSGHPLEKWIANSTLKACEILNEDRILKLLFQTKKHSFALIGEFFPKHPNYYLVDENSLILHSLYPVSHSHYTLPSKKNLLKKIPLFPVYSSQELEKAFKIRQQTYLFETLHKKIYDFLNDSLNKCSRRQNILEKSLEESLTWPSYKHRADLMKAYFGQIKRGMKQIMVWDWELEENRLLDLDPLKDALEQMSAYFKKAKKLKLAFIPLNEQIDKLKSLKESLQNQISELTKISTFEDLELFEKTLSLSKPSQKHKLSLNPPLSSPIYKEFISEQKIKIWVGRNQKANDALTFRYANGNDLWLHASGQSGSHVIIKKNGLQAIDDNTLAEAAQLALYHSKAKLAKEGEVVFTERKYVSRLKQKGLGKVQIAKHQKMWVKLDLAIIDKLKNSG